MRHSSNIMASSVVQSIEPADDPSAPPEPLKPLAVTLKQRPAVAGLGSDKFKETVHSHYRPKGMSSRQFNGLNQYDQRVLINIVYRKTDTQDWVAPFDWLAMSPCLRRLLRLIVINPSKDTSPRQLADPPRLSFAHHFEISTVLRSESIWEVRTFLPGRIADYPDYLFDLPTCSENDLYKVPGILLAYREHLCQIGQPWQVVRIVNIGVKWAAKPIKREEPTDPNGTTEQSQDQLPGNDEIHASDVSQRSLPCVENDENHAVANHTDPAESERDTSYEPPELLPSEVNPANVARLETAGLHFEVETTSPVNEIKVGFATNATGHRPLVPYSDSPPRSPALSPTRPVIAATGMPRSPPRTSSQVLTSQERVSPPPAQSREPSQVSLTARICCAFMTDHTQHRSRLHLGSALMDCSLSITTYLLSTMMPTRSPKTPHAIVATDKLSRTSYSRVFKSRRKSHCHQLRTDGRSQIV